MLKFYVLGFMVFFVNFSYAQGDVVDVASTSKDHSTLVTAIKTADLASALKGAGPFTVFAPVNAAFEKLPAGELDKLLQDKSALGKILKYHVVSGKWDAATLATAMKRGNGVAELVTLAGGKLTIVMDSGKVKITDENGGSAYVTVPDVAATNGVIHVIDALVMPK